jgi:acetylornithine/succinyldiaminopimelate/putrescine aminotransferase
VRGSVFDDEAAAWETYARHVAPGKVAAYESLGLKLTIGRREGVRIHDAFSERSWIDCHGNGGVFNLGHRHPGVLAAVRAALESVDVGNHHLVSPYRAELACRLASTTGGELPGVVFGVGGGEAMDLAIKVCRAVTGRRGVVSARGGYHGHTGLAMAAGDAAFRDPFGPNLPGFEQVPFNDLRTLDTALHDGVAAVVLEPVPATLGMPICDDGYLPAVARLCAERGAKLIVDEVQTGLGRCGRIWCHQHAGIRPDAVVTGKGLSGGIYPITATLLTRELHGFFAAHPFVHISTFGGAEPGCAAALAVLDAIAAPGFLDRARELSERIAERLAGLPFELRRKGMMMGLKFPRPDAGIDAARRLFARGVFAVYAANDTSVLQFLPPLIISDEELDEVLDAICREWA